MYKIYCNSTLIFDELDVTKNFRLENPQLELEAGKSGQLQFTIYPEHPSYDNLPKLTAIITVYDDEDLIFRGRILSSEENKLGARKVTCEGDLSFLNDTVQRPYDFSQLTVQRKTPRQLLEFYITEHNKQVPVEKQFTVGLVTVTLQEGVYLRPADYKYESTMSNISKHLVNEAGGYLLTRHENNVTYLDYLAEFTEQAVQTIEFGKNLIDLTKETNGEDIVTAIIPIGNENEETGLPITIKGVIDPQTQQPIDVDYLVNQDLAGLFGLVFKKVEFDTDLRSDLLAKAKVYLNSLSSIMTSIEVTALDLAKVEDISGFRLATSVHVKSSYNGINGYFPLTKLSLDLLNPVNSKLTLGTTLESLTDGTVRQRNQTANQLNTVERSIIINNSEIAKLAEQTYILSVTFNGTVATATEKNGNEWAYMNSTSNGRVRINCLGSEMYPNVKTVTTEPSDRLGYFGLKLVSEEVTEVISGVEVTHVIDFYRPVFLKRIFTTNNANWYDINDTTYASPMEGILICGVFNFETDSATLWDVARSTTEANTESFMDYLATVQNINEAGLTEFCRQAGIETVFNKIAILEAFVNKLFANELSMTGEGLLKSSNFSESQSSVANGVFPTRGYKLKATPDSNEVQCSFYNARMAMLKAINAEFWRTTLHGIVDHDNFKTTSAGEGVASLEIATPNAYYYETQMQETLATLAKTYGTENGVYAQITDGLTYTLSGFTNAKYKGYVFDTVEFFTERSIEPTVVNGKLKFSVFASRYELRILYNLIQFTYNGVTYSSDNLVNQYYVSDEIWNILAQIPENNVCDSVTGTVNIGGDSMTASQNNPIRIVNDGSTVSFTNNAKTLSLTYHTYVKSSLYVTGISTATSYDGIEVKNMLPKDGLSTYTIGTSNKKFTVWGAVFN